MQKEFPDLVVAWYEIDNNVEDEEDKGDDNEL